MQERNLEKFFDRLLQENFGDSQALEMQQKEAAERLGLDPEDVNVRKDVLVTSLSREGVLVDLHIGRTRFMRRLSEEDLGLNPENEDHKKFLAEYVRLGDKYLINNTYLRALNNIEGSARRTIEKYGFRTRWGVFVPYRNWEVMKQELDEYQSQYFTIRDDIIANYDVIKEETETVYRQAARESYKFLALDKNAVAPEEFVNKFTEAAMKHFPAPDRIYASFYFELDIGFVPLTSMIEEEKARTELIRQREELIKRELDLEEKKLTEEERVQRAQEYAKLEIIEAQKRTQVMAEHYKQEQIQEIHKETLESYRRGVDSFLADVVGRVRGMIYEACSTVRDNVAKNGAVTAGDSRRLQSLIKKVEALNFTDDAQVNQYLAELRDILETPAQKRDAGEVKAMLDDIAAENRQVLLLLGCEPRSVRGKKADEIDIEIEPIEPLVRKRRLDFPPVEPEPVAAEPLRRRRVI